MKSLKLILSVCVQEKITVFYVLKTRGLEMNCSNATMLSLNIKGTFLKCQASRPSYTQFLGSTWVTMNCQAEDGPSHGLPRYYELKSLTDIPQGDFGMGGLFSSADENGNYLHPVLFGIEPIEEIVPMD
ncbi:hypothetical protein N9K16_04520 [Alphaproteobacteria bacterium]|nr:hypothetical protein [Alphaproteobacteria bacterium]